MSIDYILHKISNGKEPNYLIDEFSQPVHSRYRRSSGSDAGEQREKRDKLDAVATKSSLDENVSPVIDLQSLDGEAGKGLDGKEK